MSHQQNHFSLEKHPKQDFQVERIAFFSDAVFAIAITLLVLEIRPPEITKEITAAQLGHALGEMKYKLLAMLLSFALIIGYWMRHHTLFKHIHNYNKKIIIVNMITLLPIIFFPFTTSFLYGSVSSDNDLVIIPYRLFFLNNVLAGAAMYWFYYTIMKEFPQMSYPISKEDAVKFEQKLLLLIITFSLIVIISFFSFKHSAFGVLPVILLRLINRKKTAQQKTIQ